MTLEEITREMAACNGFTIKPFFAWPKLHNYGYNYTKLRRQAECFDGDEALTFVDGEDTAAEELADKYAAHDLHRFLNDVFDGVLHEHIAVPPGKSVYAGKMPRLVVGCNYHTTWQRHKAMRFLLLDVNFATGKARLGTRRTKRKFWTDIDDLIFIETSYNQRKADLIEAQLME